jgi:hypothetical protein
MDAPDCANMWKKASGPMQFKPDKKKKKQSSLNKVLHKNTKLSTVITLFALIKKHSLLHPLPACLIFPPDLHTPANLTQP